MPAPHTSVEQSSFAATLNKTRKTDSISEKSLYNVWIKEKGLVGVLKSQNSDFLTFQADDDYLMQVLEERLPVNVQERKK